MLKFRKVTVVLKDERNGKTLKLTAEPFTLNEFLEPKSGVLLDAVVQFGNTRVKQSAIVMKDYKLLDDADAESTARVVLADLLEHLASVAESLRLSPALDQAAEWRAFVQSKASFLYHAAQQKWFVLDILEAASQFGQYCELLKFVYLFFLSTHNNASKCAETLRSVAAYLDGKRLLVASL